MIYAIDTNIISYLLRTYPQVESKFQETVKNGNECIIPPMVYYEIKRWLILNNAKSKLKRFESLCLSTKKITVDINIWDKAIEIYTVLAKNGNLISDNDILIAAYCLINDYTLVTNNTNEFMRVPGLEVENWA